MKTAELKHREKRKAIRALFTEYNSLGWPRHGIKGFPVPLEQPYQKGYIGTYVIKPMYERSWMGENLKKALALVNVKEIHKNEDFTFRPSRKQRKRGYLSCQQLPVLKKLTDEQLAELPTCLSKYFIKTAPTLFYYFGMHRFERGWTLDSKYIELHVEPNMVTHRIEVDNERESRVGRLREKIFRDILFVKQQHYEKTEHFNYRPISKKYKLEMMERDLKKDTEIQIDEFYTSNERERLVWEDDYSR